MFKQICFTSGCDDASTILSSKGIVIAKMKKEPLKNILGAALKGVVDLGSVEASKIIEGTSHICCVEHIELGYMSRSVRSSACVESACHYGNWPTCICIKDPINMHNFMGSSLTWILLQA